MRMGPAGSGMGMGSGNSQFPGMTGMNMMGGGQPGGGFNHMMQPSGSGVQHPGNSELFLSLSTKY